MISKMLASIREHRKGSKIYACINKDFMPLKGFKSLLDYRIGDLKSSMLIKHMILNI